MRREEGLIPFEVMKKGPFAFLWPVCIQGYDWSDDFEPAPLPDEASTAGRPPWLVDPIPIGRRGEYRQYAPLDRPGLHSRFGSLRPEPKAIRNFANRYGLLGQGNMLVRGGTGSAYRGESLNSWTAAIAQMAAALRLWNLVQQKEVGPLARHVTWTSKTSVGISWQIAWTGKRWELGTYDPEKRPSAGHASTLSNHAVQPELAARWGYGNIVEPARYYVHLAVNRRLLGHVSPAVLPFRQGEICMFPDTLLAALYVNFALELSGRRHPAVQCAGCERVFVPGHGNQRYHDDACRKLAWYHKPPEEERNVQKKR